MSTTKEANNPIHYIIVTVAVFIGLFGVYIRFAGDTVIYSWIGNTFMVLGVVVALKGVFGMLK